MVNQTHNRCCKWLAGNRRSKQIAAYQGVRFKHKRVSCIIQLCLLCIAKQAVMDIETCSWLKERIRKKRRIWWILGLVACAVWLESTKSAMFNELLAHYEHGKKTEGGCKNVRLHIYEQRDGAGQQRASICVQASEQSTASPRVCVPKT
jgi:hypothetical protein